MIKKVSRFCKQLSQAGKLFMSCQQNYSGSACFQLYICITSIGAISLTRIVTHTPSPHQSPHQYQVAIFFLTRQQSINRADYKQQTEYVFLQCLTPRISERTGIYISGRELNNIDLCSTFLSGKLTLLTRVYRQSGREVKRNTLGQKVMKTQLVLAIGLLDKSKPVGLRKVSEANAVAEHKNRCSAVWRTALRSQC